MAVILFAIMVGILYQRKNQFNQNLLEQSKNLAHDLTVLREWTIKHRGIYVKKSLARPNLPIKGVSENISTPSISTDQNKEYILKRFSHISKELSDISRKSNSNAFYHATSFKPINPEDAPDAFERNGLSLLQRTGANEHYGVESEKGKTYFRYMQPRITTPGCMICHAHYGYEPGKVNSALSIKIDITKDLKPLNFTSITTIIMLDIDNFKSINDNYGHDVGDIAIKELTSTATNSLRNFDTVFRYGGEEFVVISVSYTISIGCAKHKSSISADVLISEADKALYRAKSNGRNRVES